MSESIQALCAIPLTLLSDLSDTSYLSSSGSASPGDDKLLLIAWGTGVGKTGEEIEIAQVTLADN